MNRQQYLLGKLAEEASEIAQIALKAQQFGLDSVCPYNGETNKALLNKEYNDLWAVAWKLNVEFNTDILLDTDLLVNKEAKIEKFYKISVELGQVQEETK